MPLWYASPHRPSSPPATRKNHQLNVNSPAPLLFCPLLPCHKTPHTSHAAHKKKLNSKPEVGSGCVSSHMTWHCRNYTGRPKTSHPSVLLSFDCSFRRRDKLALQHCHMGRPKTAIWEDQRQMTEEFHGFAPGMATQTLSLSRMSSILLLFLDSNRKTSRRKGLKVD